MRRPALNPSMTTDKPIMKTMNRTFDTCSPDTRNRPRLTTLAVLTAAAVSLAGCGSLNRWVAQEDAVDYRSTSPGAGNPLSVPPDLTRVGENAPFRAPEGSATYSQFERQIQTAGASARQPAVLPTTDVARVMRDGNLRWLMVDMPAETVFPKVLDFWTDQGFTIQSQDARAGLIQTDWAEDRAKVPDDWIKGTLGYVFGSLFDSGERERFRTRLERVDGGTEIYISHDQMVEAATADNTGFRWVEGRENPELNAAMLARLMVALGTPMEQARTKVADAQQVQNRPQLTRQLEEARLTLNEDFDRAWRRVGLAIDSAGFSVEDRDRSTGEYFIRYLDTDTGRKIEQAGFFSRLFGGKGTSEAQNYRVHIAQQGEQSQVTIRNEQGQPENSETTRRIVTVLADAMNL